MNSRRIAAGASLGLLVAATILLLFTAARSFPRGLLASALVVVALLAGWEALKRRGTTRTLLAAVAVLLLVAFVVVLVSGRILAEALVAAVLLGLSAGAARQAFRIRVPLPAADRPKRPVVVWNPRSGGGKAAAAHLDDEARARGIEAIELRPGDDLVQLVRDAVARGADALGAAGGDGTQALVATIAAEFDLPFACIPAGTRNHFALDIGVDRADVVGALDALVDGGERRVDLAEVNGRVFVNNVSLGLYAEAVQREGYREAKVRTVLDTVPDFAGGAVGAGATAGDTPMRFDGPDGAEGGHAIAVLVSNNSYRLGRLIGSGTRPRIDDGVLGIAVVEAPAPGHRARPALRRWEATNFTVDSDRSVPAGVDGEALMIEPPLRFTIRPGVLRVRIAPHHPGASPSAAQPDNPLATVRDLMRIARTGR